MTESPNIPIPATLEAPPRSTGDARLDYPQLVDYIYRAYQVIQQAVDYINQQVEVADLDTGSLPDPASSNTYTAQLTANTAYVLADEANDRSEDNEANITTNASNIATNAANIATNTADIATLTTHDPATVTDTASINMSITGQEISGVVIPGGVDHGSLANLTDDDHTNYALLAGRSSGQTLNGGNTSGDNLTLRSTSHPTKGDIVLGTSVYDEANNRLGLGTSSPTETLDVNNDTIRVRSSKTPSSASDTGTQGQWAWDSNYIYVCTATDTWKRAALSTW